MPRRGDADRHVGRQRRPRPGVGAGRPGHPDAHAGAVDAALTGPDTTAAVDESSTTTTAPPASTTTAKAPVATPPTIPGEAPMVLARRAMLSQADVPAGFTVTSPAPTDGSAPADTPLERCAGPDAVALTAAIGARARSATFARPDVGSVSSTAVVFDQPASAEKVLALMTTPAARSCFEGLINARLARNPNLSQDVTGLARAGAVPVGRRRRTRRTASRSASRRRTSTATPAPTTRRSATWLTSCSSAKAARSSWPSSPTSASPGPMATCGRWPPTSSPTPDRR